MGAQGRHHQGDDLRRRARESRPQEDARARARRRSPTARASAPRSRPSSRRNSCATRSRAAAPSFRRNINHAELEPMIIGRNFLVKINANIGNSAVHVLGRGGSRKDGVGDPLGRRHRDGPLHRPQHPQHARMDPAQFAGADRHRADLPGAGEGATAIRSSSTWELYKDTLIEQCEQGVDYFTIHAGVRLAYVPLTANRVTGIVSRGGSIMAKWCLAHHKESFLYDALRGDLRPDAQVRRVVLARRRPAPRLDRGRQRPRAIRRARNARRADARSRGARAAR